MALGNLEHMVFAPAGNPSLVQPANKMRCLNLLHASNSITPPWGKYINFNVPSSLHIQGYSVKYLNFNVLVAIQRPGFIETVSAIQRSSCKRTPSRFA